MATVNKFMLREEIDEINKAHCIVIRNAMFKVLAEFGPEAQNQDGIITRAGGCMAAESGDEDDDDEDGEEHAEKKAKKEVAPHEVQGPGRRRQDTMHETNMLHLPDDKDKKFLTIAEVMKSADAQHNAILEKPWYVTERSNRDILVARYIMNNCEELIKGIPIRCKAFHLLVSQRLAIMVMTSPLPQETFTELEITETSMRKITGLRARKQPFNTAFNIEEGALPNFIIADYCTGSGKTIMAIMAALSLLCDENAWAELRKSYDDILRSRRREPHSGLCKGKSCEKAKLARLAIAFVPNTVLCHWHDTAQSAKLGIQEIFGTKVDIVVIKGSVTRTTIQEIYDSGKPTIWVVSMSSDSLKILRTHPEIGYAVRIYDELNVKARCKYDQPESPAIFNYVTQATIEALKQATFGQPRQPLRLALGDNFVPISEVCKDSGLSDKYSKVQMGLEHLCKLRQFAAPEFLRKLVAETVQDNMPSGMIVQRLTLRVSTLNGSHTGSDMVTVNLLQMASNMMGTGVAEATRKLVNDLFDNKAVWKASEIVSTLEETHADLTVTTFLERNAKDAVGRCMKNMRAALNKRLPDCPMTEKPVTFCNANVMSCCTGVVSEDGLKLLKDLLCPFCTEIGQPKLTPVIVEESSEEEESGENLEPPESPSMVEERNPEVVVENPTNGKKTTKSSSDDECDSEYGNEEEEEEPDDIDDAEKKKRLAKDAILEQKISNISKRKLPMGDGIIATLNAQIERDASSRILLCFGFEGYQRVIVKKLIQRIKKDVGKGDVEVTDVEDMMKTHQKAADAKLRFDNASKYPAPQIFVLNTRATSSSVQGMDLFATDLTIVAGECNDTIKRQAAGRSLRMRKRPAWMKATDRFHPKRLLIAQVMTHNREDDAVAKGEDNDDDGGSLPHNQHGTDDGVNEDTDLEDLDPDDFEQME